MILFNDVFRLKEGRFSRYRMIELFLRRFSADCGLTASDDFGGHKLQALSDMLL
jgi:hypothetical protein